MDETSQTTTPAGRSRRDFLRVLGAGAAALALPAWRSAGPDGRRPNVVFVMADDLGYGDLACYGHPVVQTPHLDRFAAEGLRLTACYAPAPNCSPSRAAVLTGRHPYRVGIYNWIPQGNPMHLRREEVTVAEVLKAEGYDTCFVGKWHLSGAFNSSEQPQPGDHGFDHWYATANRAVPSHLNPTNFVRNGEPLGRQEGLAAHLVVEEAIDWLAHRPDPERPFALVVWFHEPHTIIKTTEAYRARYPDATETEATYYGDVTHMDAAFGRLMEALDARGLRDDTLVWFMSDNGPEYRPDAAKPGSAGPLRGKKGHTYEGGIRVPGMIRWPGHVAPGRVSDVPVSGLDLLPTLCDALDHPPPPDRPLDGVSILPLLDGGPFERRQPLYWQMNNAHHPHKIAMREGDWKLLATRDFASLELYNLRRDPGEQHDLAAEEPERRDRMAARLKRLHDDIAATGHQWPGLNDLGRPVR